MARQLQDSFFDRSTCQVARELLGKIIRFKYRGHWLAALIIETEAYELNDRASHASLGHTPKRKALFMSPGTIYMYYARGGDSFNVSCRGPGNAVLIKSGHYFYDKFCSPRALEIMLKNNPVKNSSRQRPVYRLCSGQTLLCRSLGIRVVDWDQKNFDPQRFFIESSSPPLSDDEIAITTRLGIPVGRDEHLPYRFIHSHYVASCTKPPLKSSCH